jgi:hypothetical protein
VTRVAGGSVAVWRRACLACTEAKRKCSKQVPACRRCDQRGLPCLYPPARSAPERSTTNYAAALPSPPDTDAPLQASSGATPGLEQEQGHAQPAAHWFLAPDSWEVAHIPPLATPELFGDETLSSYLATVQGWLRMWVTDDHCPFIHRYLYRVHMPRRVQDAYSTISLYLHRTPATEGTVRRIIEQRLHQLMGDSAVESALELGVPTFIDHISRVQALLALLVICLFDGNIRLRAQGELHLPTLLAWNDQMWQEATQEMRRDATLEPWRLWIFSESLRRTWLTTSIINGVYVVMTHGYTWCPGGVYCTFGNELWDATTAHDWEKRSNPGRKRLFMQSLDVGELLTGEDPDVVDAFGHAIMLITFGVDKIQGWTASKRAPADG